MKRYHKQLSKDIKAITTCLQQETFKNTKVEREQLGVDLYGLQQQLARQQMMLEKEQDNLGAVNQLRKQKEELLEQVKQMYQDTCRNVKDKRKQGILSILKCSLYTNNFIATDLRKDVESLGAKLKYLTDAHKTLKTDIAVTKRAAEKTDVDMTETQAEKKEQVPNDHVNGAILMCFVGHVFELVDGKNPKA